MTAGPVPDPLAGRTLAEICRDYGLSLVAFPYQTLAEDFTGTCCGDGGLDPGSFDCQLDWPSSDVPSCSIYDYMRNAIYARYGFPFSSATYQDEFGGEPWYVERPDFDPSWLSPEAEANVLELIQLRDDEVGCTP